MRALTGGVFSAPAYRALPRQFVRPETRAPETHMQKIVGLNAKRWNGQRVEVEHPVLNSYKGRFAPVQKSNQINIAVQECFTDYIGYQDSLFQEFARLQRQF